MENRSGKGNIQIFETFCAGYCPIVWVHLALVVETIFLWMVA